jgi:hypothetical protein
MRRWWLLTPRFLTPEPKTVVVRRGVRPFVAWYLSLDTRLLDGAITHVAGPSGAPAHRRATSGSEQAAVR